MPSLCPVSVLALDTFKGQKGKLNKAISSTPYIFDIPAITPKYFLLFSLHPQLDPISVRSCHSL